MLSLTIGRQRKENDLDVRGKKPKSIRDAVPLRQWRFSIAMIGTEMGWLHRIGNGHGNARNRRYEVR